ncbi:hypothetical protein Ciccas_007453, partial [Cichlidogyrus casuarinus]
AEVDSLISFEKKATFQLGKASDVQNKQSIETYKDPNDQMGLWEQHTRGIGSKLLFKMGYTGSGGLGRYSSGRAFPVATHGMLKQIISSSHNNKHPSLDAVINGHKQPSDRASTSTGGSYIQKLRQKSDKELKVQLYNLEKEIEKLQQKMEKSEGSVKRNISTDTLVSSRADQSFRESKSKLAGLLAQKRKLESVCSERNSHKKLNVF